MRKRYAAIVTMLAAGLSAASPVAAQTPTVFQKLLRSSTEAKGQNLELKPEHGPWLIYAATLEGEDCKMRAVKLAAELRHEFGLAAYVMPKTLDYSSSIMGLGVSATGKERKMRYADDRVVESFSVLVGDFASLEAPETRAALARVKTIKPAVLGAEDPRADGEVTSGEKVGIYRSWLKRQNPEATDTTAGPMANAFLTRNPLLPEEFYAAPELDEFISDLNKRAQHSIFDCKGRFTVRIANFTGGHKTVLAASQTLRQSSGESVGSSLEEAALVANQLAELLRRAGYDAFEYHDRASSSVCIGSFDSLGAMDASGNFVYSPEIQKIVEDFGGAKDFRPSQYGPLPVAKTLLDVVNYKTYPELSKGTEKEKLAKVQEYSIPFESNPKPIFVPRPATRGLYNKSLLGQR